MKPLFQLLVSAWIFVAVAACTTVISQTTPAFPQPTNAAEMESGLDSTDIVSPTIAPTPVPTGPSIRGVFEGITPCSPLTRPLPQIPANTDCEMTIWQVVFNPDSIYTLKASYGMTQPNSPGIRGGGTPITMEGTWAESRGTRADPTAIVLQLTTDNLHLSVSFLKVSDDLIHLLAEDKTLMVGNGGWSYTLNRTDNQIPIQVTPDSPPGASTRPPLPALPTGSSVLGVFVGRTRCHDIVLEFTKVAPYSGCARIKWEMTLYQDQATGTPSTYLYLGTGTIREGSWTIIRGTDTHPEAVVYQLHLDNAQPPVSFLRVDENHLFLLDRALNFLVGDALLSYTLSRTEGAQ